MNHKAINELLSDLHTDNNAFTEGHDNHRRFRLHQRLNAAFIEQHVR